MTLFALRLVGYDAERRQRQSDPTVSALLEDVTLVEMWFQSRERSRLFVISDAGRWPFQGHVDLARM